MPQPHIAERAESDLQDIWDYVSADSVERADRLIENIRAKAAVLAEFPRMGRPRDDLLPGLRSLPFGDYVIFYWPVPDGIQVLRVLHGARDIQRIFGAASRKRRKRR